MRTFVLLSAAASVAALHSPATYMAASRPALRSRAPSMVFDPTAFDPSAVAHLLPGGVGSVLLLAGEEAEPMTPLLAGQLAACVALCAHHPP